MTMSNYLSLFWKYTCSIFVVHHSVGSKIKFIFTKKLSSCCPNQPAHPLRVTESNDKRYKKMSSTTNNNVTTPFSLDDDEDVELANFYMHVEPKDDATAADDNQEEAIAELHKLFPTHDKETLSAVLVACNQNVSSARRTLQLSAPQQTTAGTTDEALAEHLQQQEQQLEIDRLNIRRNKSNQKLCDVKMKHLISTLDEIVVPALKAHFEELKLPNYTNNNETTGLLYELKNVQVSALTLAPHNVSIKPSIDNHQIFINILSANLELEIGHWKYQNRLLGDQGKARCSVHGLNINITVIPYSNIIHIGECDVSIDGVVKFKSRGAAADWAYNAFAVVCKPWLVAYVKDAVKNTVCKALNVLLTQIESSNDPLSNVHNNNVISSSSSAMETTTHNTSQQQQQHSVSAME